MVSRICLSIFGLGGYGLRIFGLGNCLRIFALGNCLRIFGLGYSLRIFGLGNYLRIFGLGYLADGPGHPQGCLDLRAEERRLSAHKKQTNLLCVRLLRVCGSQLAVCLVSLFVSVCRSCVSSSSVPRPPIPRWCPVRAWLFFTFLPTYLPPV